MRLGFSFGSLMDGYLQLLGLLAPIFLIIALGLVLRRTGVLYEEADRSLLNLVVRLFYPCLIFKSVLAASSLEQGNNVILSPIAGFFLLTMGIAVGWGAAKAIGLEKGSGLRTFCFSIAVFNYAYIPIPLVEELYGNDVLAVLFLFNVGVEFGIWTIGISYVSGSSIRDGLGKALNPSVFALVAALLINQLGGASLIPFFVVKTIEAISACAIPVGLLVIGATLDEFFAGKERIFDAKTGLVSVALRLGILPLLMLGFAMLLPISSELKKVIVVQSALPAGIMPIALAKHYNGQPIVAFRIVVATTIVGLLAIPLWIRFGNWLLLR